MDDQMAQPAGRLCYLDEVVSMITIAFVSMVKILTR